MIESEAVACSPSVDSFPKRKRKFRIFQSLSKAQTEKEDVSSDIVEPSAMIKMEKKVIVRPHGVESGFVKIPKKESLENELLAEDDADFFTVQPCLQGYCTVGSQKFGTGDEFFKQKKQPSFLMKNDSLIINQASILFKSVSEVKDNFYSLEGESHFLSSSISDLTASVSKTMLQSQNASDTLEQLQDFLNKMKNENKQYQQKIARLNQRVSQLELRKSLSPSKRRKVSEQTDKLKWFIEQKKQRKYSLQEQGDEFVVTQLIPETVIAEFIQMRRMRQHEQRRIKNVIKEQDKRLSDIAKNFHPSLGMTVTKYLNLAKWITDQFPDRQNKGIKLNLLLKKGTTDLESSWVGEQENLEYNQCLLFILRTSYGKCIGGFISNCLIEGEIREDPHAFIFSLEGEGTKFSVKEEFQEEAYECSKHYLVCFGSDLMISLDCLQEQSYCEWPNSYQGLQGRGANWLTGDFSFMIEHIEVYQVGFK